MEQKISKINVCIEDRITLWKNMVSVLQNEKQRKKGILNIYILRMFQVTKKMEERK